MRRSPRASMWVEKPGTSSWPVTVGLVGQVDDEERVAAQERDEVAARAIEAHGLKPFVANDFDVAQGGDGIGVGDVVGEEPHLLEAEAERFGGDAEGIARVVHVEAV